MSEFALFDGIARPSLEPLESAARVRHLAKGQIQFLPGDRSEALFFLVSGRIKISRLAVSGKELILDLVEPGDVFGELGLLSGALRETMAEAIEASKLWVVPAVSFRALLRCTPELLLKLTLRIARRQSLLERRLIDAAHNNASHRLSRLLLELSKTYGIPGRRGIALRIRLSQATIGNMLGVSREIVNHELVRLRERGAIELIEGRILIRHPSALLASASRKTSSAVKSVTTTPMETCSV